jgi:hypothetical protein
MLDYEQTREQHIFAAQQRMRPGSVYAADVYPNFPACSRMAYGLGVSWLAQYIAKHRQWVQELEATAKRPLVDWIVGRLAISNPVEQVLASLFVAELIDVAFAAFVAWETGNPAAGAEMLRGTMRQTLVEWAREV